MAVQCDLWSRGTPAIKCEEIAEYVVNDQLLICGAHARELEDGLVRGEGVMWRGRNAERGDIRIVSL